MDFPHLLTGNAIWAPSGWLLGYNLTNTALRHFIQKIEMWCYRLGGTKIQQDLVMLDSINSKKTLKEIFSEK